jgi:DNA primase
LITKATIQKIHEALDIVDVVSDFVALKKKGTSWQACCPFHNERSPSFSVSPAKGIFHCFGCHKAGNALTFVMEAEKCSYPEALRYLAKKYHIEIEEEQVTNQQAEQQSLRESLLVALNFAKDYYKNILLKDDDGRALGYSYFKERGFQAHIIEKFELGYSKDEWQGLENEAISKSFTKDILEKSGLIIKKEDGKSYDRFRGRVMFPIHNLAGKVVGFGARTLKKDDKPKYLNSPETEVYIKNEILYGIYQAKTTIRNLDECLLTEGYTDVISLHQNGIENAVASSGTALTDNQIRLIKRFTDNITVLYDGDSAGIKAALRGIDLLLAQGMNVKAVVFPDNEDPDSYVKKVGGEAFKKYISDNSKDFITFKTELYLGEAGTDPIKRAGVIRTVVESISKIPDAIKRSVFFKQTSQLMGISEDILISESNKILLTQQKSKEKELEKSLESQLSSIGISNNLQETNAILDSLILDQIKQSESTTIEKLIEIQEEANVTLLVKYGQYYLSENRQLWQYLFEEWKDINFQKGIYKDLIDIYKTGIEAQMVQYYDANLSEINMQYFLANTSLELQKKLSQLLIDKYDISDGWGKQGIFVPLERDNLALHVYKSIMMLKYRTIELFIVQNMGKMVILSDKEKIQKLSEVEIIELDDLLRKHIEWMKIRTNLSTEAGLSPVTGDKLPIYR